MAEPFQMLLDVAWQKPDPPAVNTWLAAYLGTRPLKAKHAALSALESQVKALTPPPDVRVLGLVLRVIEKSRENLK